MSLLLGYYADMLFTEHTIAFNKTVQFLFESMGYVGLEKVVALQSIDTLNTVVSDAELSPRLLPILTNLIPVLVDQIGRLNEPKFFDFIR